MSHYNTGAHERLYNYHRSYGRVDVDIAREDLAQQVTGFAWHQQSEVILLVAPDGTATAHLIGIPATDSILKQRQADIVGTCESHGQLKGRRDKIKARILADLRHHFPGRGEKVAA